jgi:hypothetical protein
VVASLRRRTTTCTTTSSSIFSSKGSSTDNKYLQSSQQSLPSPSPDFHFPSLFSARDHK